MASLREFQSRGGEVILMDTGSSDKSAEVARAHGCTVHEVGERFMGTIDDSLAERINNFFLRDPGYKIVRVGDRYFDYSAARNYAASLSKTDMVAMPDCDEEYTKLDLDKINDVIERGAEQLEYEFVFAHAPDGSDLIKFRHCKFYNRTKLKWTGVVHEVLAGHASRVYLDTSTIKLEHWQNPSDNRTRYLTGLAVDCYKNPDNDRNSHYFAREMLFCGLAKSAYHEFSRHIAMKKWPTEAAQSMIYQGDALMIMGKREEAIARWHDSVTHYGNRREAWMRLASHYHKANDYQRAASYANAALAVPYNDFYGNNMEHYRHGPHEILYWAYWWLGDKSASFEHWKRAKSYWPDNRKFMHDSVFYLDMLRPKVVVIIPALGGDGRSADETRDLVKQRAGWWNTEVEVVVDDPACRKGCPITLKRGVEGTHSDFVLFLGSDCVPENGFVLKALECMYRSFPEADGLVGLNDGIWKKGEIACHWLASRKLLPHLDGEFFYTGYHHLGCDNELTARCQLMGRYVWCEEAKIEHRHPASGFPADKTHELAWSRKDEDRALLRSRAKAMGFEHLLI